MISLVLVLAMLGQSPKFEEVKPTIQPKSSSILMDIDSQMERKTAATYRNQSDLINWAHEGTHAVNSRLRNEVDKYGKTSCFYCLNGRYVKLSNPKLRLHQVLPFIPQDFREPNLMQTYWSQKVFDGPGLPNTAGWDDNPLYPLDEFVAYTNGFLCGEQEHITRDGCRNAVYFCSYATCVIQATIKYDPGYKDMQGLKDFVGWNIDRVEGLVSRTGDSKQLFQRFKEVYATQN